MQRQLAEEDRRATPEEHEVLQGWTGWGALPQVFDIQSSQHSAMAGGYAELKGLLSETELAAARRSTLNAHYTDPRYVGAIWNAVQKFGFEQGQVLEPGCGSGNFIAAAPAGARCTGVELDPSTARIAKSLFPDAAVLSESFADSRIAEDSIDLVVGNVPFGAVTLHDKRHNAARHSIHNHFILKSAHLLRPGGLMAVVTSRYSMDAKNPAARRELAALGDLLGAVRLPTGAHKHLAGTDVVTDVLLFQKRTAGRVISAQPFESSVQHDGAGFAVNEYFHAHPEDVLGEFALGQGEGGRPELVVKARGDTAAQLQEALSRIVGRAQARGHQWDANAAPVLTANPVARVQPGIRPNGYISAADGSFSVVEEDTSVELKVPQSQQGELRALLGLRDTTVALLEAEAASNDDTPELEALRSELNTRYEACVATHGPLNRFNYRRTGRVDAVTGDEKLAKVRPRQGGFRTDPFANVVYALEHFVESEQVAHKASIFTERVIARPAQRLGADSPEDALAICLDTVGQVELPIIARLLGVEPDEAREQLGELVFSEPGTQRLVTASEYLSGNVRLKLSAAEQAADAEPRFAGNVAALLQVQPRDLQPSEIQANLGAVWIEARYVQSFLQEILDDPSVRVEHGHGSMWELSGRQDTVLATSKWGTEQCSALAVAKSSLEQRPIRIYSTTSDGERVFNASATVAATEKSAEMAEYFSDWVWAEPTRATALARAYNDRFNAIVGRDYSLVRPSMAGLAVSFRPREHQVAAVAQSIFEPAVGLFHEVGAGKTACMIMGVMEKQRLGLLQKPVVVVPNHMLEQFSREWQQLYPQARLLAAGKDDLSRDRRRAFVARCATNRWDAVIMTRSAFERISVSQVTEKSYLEVEVKELESALAHAREQGQSMTLKRMEAVKLRREQRIKALLDTPKDPGITFEQLGFDHVVVDEAHAYKNLTLVSSIPNMAIEGSRRATDLHQKLWWLREVAKVRNVATFATATPIANSISEAYTMTRFLRPDVLSDAGIAAFDQWAATFGKTVTSLEVAPDGSSLRMQSRFAKFHNVPELMQLWSPFANVRTAADLDLPVPAQAPRPSDGQRIPEIVLVEPTSALRGFVSDIAQRAERVRNRQVTPAQDNMLSITNSGRLGALDLRLTEIEPDGKQKIDVAANRIAAIYQETKALPYPGPDGEPHPTPGALQLVFSDLGTPNSERWNVYDELRELLVQRGVPRERVRFIHEAKTDRDKHAMFASCREGRISVLLGSTEKMGVGTNVQLRTVALHHLDCPWRPADIAQREGRILRQGNANAEVQILRYVTEGSFDAYLWQTVARKAQFIGQLMKPSSDVRELDGDVGDSALSYDEVKALASGNPLLLEHAQATADLRKLERLETSHHNNQAFLARQVESGTATVVELEENLEGFAQAKAALLPEFVIEVGGERYGKDKRSEGSAALKKALKAAVLAHDGRRSWEVTLGHFRGLPIVAGAGWSASITAVSMDGLAHSPFTLDRTKVLSGEVDVLQRCVNKVSSIDSAERQDRFKLERAQQNIDSARGALAAPFPKQAALEAARQTWQEIDEALTATVVQQGAAQVEPVVENTSEFTPGVAHGASPGVTPGRPQAVTPGVAEGKWQALVEHEHAVIAQRVERISMALETRGEELQAKQQAHFQNKPHATGFAFLGGARKSHAAQMEAWEAEGERMAKAIARVDKHSRLVPLFAEPAVGVYESRGTLLAQQKVASREPGLAEEVQGARAARDAGRRGQEDALRDGRTGARGR